MADTYDRIPGQALRVPDPRAVEQGHLGTHTIPSPSSHRIPIRCAGHLDLEDEVGGASMTLGLCRIGTFLRGTEVEQTKSSGQNFSSQASHETKHAINRREGWVVLGPA